MLAKRININRRRETIKSKISQQNYLYMRRIEVIRHATQREFILEHHVTWIQIYYCSNNIGG